MGSNKFRLSIKPDRTGFCKILARNIEDYRSLGYSTKQLELVYQKICGGEEE